MFGSIALDVVTGLVLIYLLYSLFVSIVGEMISAWLSIRARMLKQAIVLMLMDEPTECKKKRKFFRWLNDFLYRDRPDFENSLADTFYNYPSIKYLGKKELNNIPSYITKENFSETLFNILREKGSGNDDMSKIDFCLKYNTLNISNETKKHIINLFYASNATPATFKNNLQNWFNETMDRLNGWYKRRIQFILFWFGFIVAVIFNVDSIHIAGILSKDKEARNQLVEMSKSLAKDSSDRYDTYVIANGDTLHSQAIIDSSYARINRDIHDANIILGLGWGIDKLLKKDQYELDYKKDSAAIRQITEIYEQQIKPGYSDISLITKQVRDFNTTSSNWQKNKLHAITELNKKKFEYAIASPEAKNKLKSDTDTAKVLLATINFQISELNSLTKVYKDSINQISKLIAADFNRIDSIAGSGFVKITEPIRESKSFTLKGERRYHTCEIIRYVIYETFTSWTRILGFIITALALSLGAPFWFDLLRKLVSIRSSGTKPEEKNPLENPSINPTDPATKYVAGAQPATASVTPRSNITTEKEEPVAIALRIYGDAIRRINGVITVAQGYLKNDEGVIKCVQVNVEDQDTAVKINSSYNPLRIGENEFIGANVIITGKPTLRSNGSVSPGRAIANQTKINGWGSYGCIVKNKYSDQLYILTCHHVLKGDYDWDNIGELQTIIKFPNIEISNSYEGHYTNQFDIAFAKVSNTIASEYLNLYKNPLKVASISSSDVYSTEVTINGYKTPNSSGIIIHDSWNGIFPYKLPNNETRWHPLNDLIAISRRDTNGFLNPSTQEGDSGSIVFDNTGNALGMVVAGDKEHTYAIKMDKILSSTGKTLELT